MANCALGKIEDFIDSKPSCNFVPDDIDEVSIAFGIENLILVPDFKVAQKFFIFHSNSKLSIFTSI